MNCINCGNKIEDESPILDVCGNCYSSREGASEAQPRSGVRISGGLSRRDRAEDKPEAGSSVRCRDKAESAARSDTDRLNWMEATGTGIGFNVECSSWGVDYEAPYGKTIRQAIDAAMDAADALPLVGSGRV